MSISQISKLSSALLAAAFLVSCGSVPMPPVASNGPAVSMVVPQSNGVGTNREIAVVFSQPNGSGQHQLEQFSGCRREWYGRLRCHQYDCRIQTIT